MAAITIQNVVKSYAGQTVLKNISLTLNKGEKVGLIGANGSGKTTLFKLIVGLESADSGTITMTRGLNAAYLPQKPEIAESGRLLDAVSDAFEGHRNLEKELQALSAQIGEKHGCPEEVGLLEKYDRLHAQFEANGGYNYEVRIREVLGGLGFSPEEYDQSVQVLSGGQKCRAALARMLMGDADFLLLDEPTNHLDLDATRWLEKYIAGHHGGAVIVSHDRYLLDRVVSKIIEIENGRATVYPTNYTNYAQTKHTRQLQAMRDYEKQREWIAHQEDYINRVRYRKDTAKQARARQKLLDNMKARGEILEKPENLHSIKTDSKSSSAPRINFKPHERSGDMVVRCEGACKGFGDIRLIKRLDFEMTRGEKVGIIGPNGVGKTTLLRMLLRQLDPDSGTVRLYENLSVGYYDQEHRDLDPDLSVIEAVREVRPEVTEAEARSYLALFLFRGDDVFKRIGNLSGGEQSRVLLARLVWTNPQVLVLDEPTNHLDIPAREALEEALQHYPGSILMVSHDRYFLDRVAGRLLVLTRREQHEIVDGNWSAYAEILSRREEASRSEELRRKEQDRREREAKTKGKPGRKKSKSKYAAQRVEELEDRIIQIETRVKEIETAFADPAFMKDQAKLKQLHIEYDRLRPELQELNEKWEEAADGLAD
ncbi:MAG: ABC-F family ATP-binding cassette domain-containing protein [Phycisphaerales bacterium]|nr:ABC-F family ATP-binding cassette domain-containing protein [Phycisphaerales bacterium]